MSEAIRLRGVRVHNLKNVDIDIPVNSLTVITGPSGSGKSSLAFDTLYAEGRRRFVQSLSSYARQFLERIDRPDADEIESIFPAIAIQQKNQIIGSRSTVGTITEVVDYLRLLFARVGIVRDPDTGELIKNDTVEDVIMKIESLDEGTRLWIMFSPVEKMKNEFYLKKGFVRAINLGKETEEIRLEEIKPRKHKDIRIVADRLIKKNDIRQRLAEAVEVAFLEGNGQMAVLAEKEVFSFDSAFRSSSGKEFLKPEAQLFSFNNPYGACPKCRGFGDIIDLNEKAIIPNPDRTLAEGAIEPWRPSTRRREQNRLAAVCQDLDIPMDVPWKNLKEEHKKILYEGIGRFSGVRGFFAKLEKKKYKMHVRVLLSRYRGYCRCPECHGTRLRKEALYVKIGKKNIGEICDSTIARIYDWVKRLKLTDHQKQIVDRVLAELKRRLKLLNDLGVGYLTLNRRAQTLSGGEVQRINLATALGGGLVGTLFVLDEPTIGLHERDSDRLISILKSIRDLGNTVVVVEHDKRVMAAADHIIDLGPGSGKNGGELVFSGSYNRFLKCKDSTTAKYLTGQRKITLNTVRRKSNKTISVINAREHNLKQISMEFPLNSFCCVTGVSGSGKSTLVHDVLYANLMHERNAWQKKVGDCDKVKGNELVREIEMVDQSAIGKSPRSNPITYIKAFSEIRNIFAERFQARIRGYKPSHFSFNVKGGRCESCQGNGEVSVEMQFMPDVHILCEDCRGRRYKREILDIKFKGLNIYEVLQLSVDQAIEIFRDYPSLVRKLKVLQEVGLGYLQLGQSATTLSGGEGQRIKLAYHMSRTNVVGSLFIFDEPTTGLHFSDIKKLLDSFRRLVFHGASVIVIEHNLEVIKNADWIIDLGPEGGDKGGWIVATGTPEDLAERDGSYTGLYLREVLSGE